MNTQNSKYLIEVKNVKKYFPIKKGLLNRTIGHVKAVDDVSFGIQEGETFGLVGESGCGKSTLGRVILQLQKATEGEVLYKDQNIVRMSNSGAAQDSAGDADHLPRPVWFP